MVSYRQEIKRPSPSQLPKAIRNLIRVVAKYLLWPYHFENPATWQIPTSPRVAPPPVRRNCANMAKNFLEPPPDIIEGEEEWDGTDLAKRICGHQQEACNPGTDGRALPSPCPVVTRRPWRC